MTTKYGIYLTNCHRFGWFWCYAFISLTCVLLLCVYICINPICMCLLQRYYWTDWGCCISTSLEAIQMATAKRANMLNECFSAKYFFFCSSYSNIENAERTIIWILGEFYSHIIQYSVYVDCRQCCNRFFFFACMWVWFRTIYLMNIQNDNTRITTTSVKYCQAKISSHKHSFAKSNIINYINRHCTRDVKPNENFKWMNASIKLEKSEWRKKKTALHKHMKIDFFLFGKLNDYANWTKVGKNKHHVTLRAYLAYFLAGAYKGSKKNYINLWNKIFCWSFCYLLKPHFSFFFQINAIDVRRWKKILRTSSIIST